MNDVSEDTNVKYENWKMTDFVLKVAKVELGETDEVRTKCLYKLKNKIEDTKHFHPQLDDNFLLKFLRVSKFDVDRALNRLKNYYKQRTKNPELFDELYPSTIEDVHTRQWSHHILPHRNTDNTAIVVTHNRLSIENPDWSNLLADVRLDLMLMDIVTDDPVTQICGITHIFDLSGLTLRNGLVLLSPNNIRLFLNVVVESLPARNKTIHIVNAPNAFVLLYNIVWPFLSHKLRKRITIHPRTGDWTSLHTFVPAKVLPEEFGGKQGPIDCSYFRNMLLSKEQRFRDSSKYGYRYY